MINIKKILSVIINSLLSLVVLLTLALVIYEIFFYETPTPERKTTKKQITKNEEPSHLQSKKKPSKKITSSDENTSGDIVNVKPVIKDSLFATIGNKAITHSDIIDEFKIVLILNGQSFSEEQREQLELVAIRSIVKRTIKEVEIEKYKNLQFNKDDINRELERVADSLNMDLDTLKNIFVTNDIDYSIIANQIKTELLWNSLIFELYKNRISININEIDEKLKSIQNKKEIEEFLISEIIIKSVPKNKLESKIREIKNKIKIEGFEKVAMTLSISETSIKGGNLGWISENIIAEKFKSTIINTPVGDVSEPILLSEGILLFKVRDKRKIKKFANLEIAKDQLVKDEKKKILNMHSVIHYENLRKSTSINYY